MPFARYAVTFGLICCLSSVATSAGAQTQPAPQPPAPAAGVPPPPTPIAFDDALLKAANDLFSKAKLPDGSPDKVQLVIDPLIDGTTGSQSHATQLMNRRIADLVKQSYPRFDVQSFSTANLAKSPIVLIGTFTPINNAGDAGGARDAYRICLALADLKSRKIVAKGVARAKPDGIDTTPTAYFSDTPAFTKDPATDAYIKSCQGTQPGDPIIQVYADRILVAALVNDAFDAYEGKRYQDSLELYRSALHTPGGEQLRVLNGIYLTNWKLGRRDQAAEAFGKIVEFGLDWDHLAVKFLFKPGSTQFTPETRASAPYSMWIAQIAKHGAAKNACLEIVGHTSPTGPAPLNDRLSLLRAEYVKDRIESQAPPLAKRMIANGVGSRQNLIGTGKDDMSDALDRRVEFRIINCGPTPKSAMLIRR